jgi:hypothetical protein
MPTGYTAAIEDGTITTGKDFIKRCVRAFGVAIDMRDEPLSVELPTEFKPNQRYYDEVESAKRDLEEAESLTPETARDRILQRNKKSIASSEKTIAGQKIILERYAKVRKEVANWNPSPIHSRLKLFALEQIDMCIDDCKSLVEFCESEIDKNRNPDLTNEGIQEYINSEIECAKRWLKRSIERLDAEIKDAEDRTKFMSMLYESIESIKEET